LSRLDRLRQAKFDRCGGAEAVPDGNGHLVSTAQTPSDGSRHVCSDWTSGICRHQGGGKGASSHWRQCFTAALALGGTGSRGYTLLVMAARSSRSWRHRSVAWRNSSSVVAAQSVRSWRSAACPGRTDSGETTHCRRQGGGTASRGGKESFSRGGRLLSSWCAAGLFVQVGRMGPHVFQAVVPQPESAVPPHLKRPTPFDFAPGFFSL
jgi:hypothetical protein